MKKHYFSNFGIWLVMFSTMLLLFFYTDFSSTEQNIFNYLSVKHYILATVYGLLVVGIQHFIHRHIPQGLWD